jgi:hypothetical protein
MVRGVRTGGGPKVPFFVLKSALFVQANVAVNTKLTSKVAFLFGNFDVFKKIWFKTCNFGRVQQENFPSSPPPPPPHPIANVSGKTFLGALFNFQKCPWKPVPPQSSDASYAPGNGNLTELLSYCISWNFS